MKVTMNIDNKKLFNLLCSAIYDEWNFRIATSSWTSINEFWYSDANEENRKSNPRPCIEDKIWTYVMASNAHIIKFVDKEDGSESFMTWTRIENGTNTMAEKYERHFMDVIMENDDAVTADVWFQCVLLDEVVYG